MGTELDLDDVAAQSQKARKELKELRANVTGVCDALDYMHGLTPQQATALRKDAERYRWLRDVGDETWVPMGKRPGVNFTHEIDQAIDAAIARAKAVGAA